jgi:hypothetical protein
MEPFVKMARAVLVASDVKLLITLGAQVHLIVLAKR